ncbi:MAG: hypothetical protein WBB23_13330 [Desulforhopalus sp.]
MLKKLVQASVDLVGLFVGLGTGNDVIGVSFQLGGVAPFPVFEEGKLEIPVFLVPDGFQTHVVVILEAYIIGGCRTTNYARRREAGRTGPGSLPDGFMVVGLFPNLKNSGSIRWQTLLQPDWINRSLEAGITPRKHTKNQDSRKKGCNTKH